MWPVRFFWMRGQNSSLPWTANLNMHWYSSHQGMIIDTLAGNANLTNSWQNKMLMKPLNIFFVLGIGLNIGCCNTFLRCTVLQSFFFVAMRLLPATPLDTPLTRLVNKGFQFQRWSMNKHEMVYSLDHDEWTGCTTKTNFSPIFSGWIAKLAATPSP